MARPLTCTRCHREFVVPSTMKGGIANCPSCGTLIDVPDPGARAAFNTTLFIIGGLIVAGSVALGAVFGPTVGIVALVSLGVLMALIVAFL